MIGLQPRQLSWIVPHRLAVGERPGGCGRTHRLIRRDEEIRWLVKQEFDTVVSLRVPDKDIETYVEAGLEATHLPVTRNDAIERLPTVFALLDELLLKQEQTVFVHADDVDDTVEGVLGSYLLHLGALPTAAQAVAAVERLTSRPLGPEGRHLVQVTERNESS